jgi:hypothetical protein
MRARDLDRSEVCSALDAAYADGQLDGEEHRTRTAAAMSAKTLGDLRALVDDLQLQQPLSEVREQPVRAPKPTRAGKVGAVVVALLFIGTGFGIAKITDGPTAIAGGGPVVNGSGTGRGADPIVVGAVALHTPEGFRTFIEGARTEFGTTTVAGATIYPDYAVVYTVAPGAPARQLSSSYKGGFESPSEAGSRDPDQPLVDLAAIDVDKILGLVAGAGESLHVTNPTTHYLIVEDDGDGPYVSVYASNSDLGESGYLKAKPDGTVMAVHAYEPG